MKLWKRGSALLLALVLALSLSVSAMAEEAAPSPEETALAAAQGAQTYGGADSVQYALWQDGKVVLTGSCGNYSRTENRALTPDTLYGIGSVSKIYTTAAVMQLAEAGRVSLDAPLTRYLKGFKMADTRYRQITVRMLLNHSSGLMGSHYENAILFGDTDSIAADSLLEQLSTQRLKADPGAYSVYCNDGFTLAELVVETVTGMEFMDYVRTHMLKPAGLENTFAPGDDFDTGRLARTYRGADTRALPRDCLNLVGTGGIYATASDLAAFGGALTGTKLLRQSSLNAMAAPEYDRGIWPDLDTPDVLSYGLGWDAVEWLPFSQSGIQALVKGGDTLRYHAGLVVIPEYHMAAAVLSSGGASAYNEMAAAQMLAAALKAQGVALDESLPLLPEAALAAMPTELTEYTGYYGSTAAQYRVDVTADGTLTMGILTMPSVPAMTFTYRDDGTFRDTTGQAAMSFVTESNGQIYLCQQGVGHLPGLGMMPTANYAAVKLPENPISPEVQAAWDRYLSTSFLPMGEKYSSQTYLALADSAAQTAVELVPGYAGASRIVDAASARYELQLPGAGGRDGQEIHVLDRNGTTWMEVNGALYMSAEGAPVIYTGAGWSYSTVQADGYARWYQVGQHAGKAMTVQVPENAGFWVYDGSGQVTASSVLWGDTTAVLPQDGFVVFAGDPGARFRLSFR
ncbi:serine hydrolase domain-containing protein [Dysosmobacter sp.]|uniref:serine hydrolase domain-containing protein n=1 Tax=Dysosmobacter sp. TaxID=2591382 RepID=UPI002AA09980|nr:serine hydrolase domain-containing protein [Dysosmobacter sp.]MDY5613525.1 serine hydrolase domain-containing protein [Dysosmobacter sp.]